MREVKRGFHYPTVAELCAVADSTGMHPILTRRFENRLQQGLSADGRNAEVLAELAEIDDHLLPFLNPIQIVSAVTELPTGGSTEGARPGPPTDRISDGYPHRGCARVDVDRTRGRNTVPVSVGGIGDAGVTTFFGSRRRCGLCTTRDASIHRVSRR